MQLLRAITGGNGHMPEFFKQGDFVTVPGLFRDEMEDDQAKITVRKETSKSGPPATVMAPMLDWLLVVWMAAAGEAATVGVMVRVGSARSRASGPCSD
jgi:hypothetical protein